MMGEAYRPGMATDQPRSSAALGTEPIHAIHCRSRVGPYRAMARLGYRNVRRSSDGLLGEKAGLAVESEFVQPVPGR